MALLLKVASVPSDSHTNSNLVYVNPADGPKVGRRVLINGFAFNIQPDAAVQPGTIALNGIQRKCVGVSSASGDLVEIPPGGFMPLRQTSIIQLSVELEYVAASKKGGTLDVKEVAKFFDANFSTQFFSERQQLAVILDPSSKYIATVVGMKATDATGADATVAEFIKGETEVIVSAKEKCEIALINVPDKQLDSQAPNIIQKFDLENLGIGGLRTEFGQVFRRAFASRIFPQSVIKRLGIQHVKGVLLHGPPGTGKTLIARKIGEILNTKPPKIVSGPELLDKFVGGTEANVRKLFAEAEADQAAKGDQSQLHLIIFDEFDSLCKQRGSVRDGTGVSDNVVNQLLSKIDGVNTLNNVLLIGMTNRKDLIDEAILRPGRFEVHVEIGLPDEDGRAEVFRIHTRTMRESGTIADDVDFKELARASKNFSGAEIAGVVRSAASYALGRHIDFENPAETINASDVMLKMEDFRHALEEVKPAFGQATDECKAMIRNDIISYGPTWEYVQKQTTSFIDHINADGKVQSMSVLLEGSVGCGKSAAAAHFAMKSNYPYIKFISNDSLVAFGEVQKANIIRKSFEDAYKSKSSVVILDDVERLIEYSHGGRYSNLILQTLLVMIKKPPPEGKRLIVIGTTSLLSVMDSLELSACFSATLHLSDVEANDVPAVVKAMGLHFATPTDSANIVQNISSGVPIKKLIVALEMAADHKAVSEERFSSEFSTIMGDGHYLNGK